jgi:NAD(P)H-hydrate epimerase
MPLPVITIEQMRQWEQATWATGQTEDAVIRRVGELVARRALRLTGDNDLILILAGRGHNGDDARCAQPHLRDRQAEVLEAGEPAVSLAPLAGLLAKRPALVIDGLFGIGLNRPLGPAWVELIESVNRSGAPVLAVDVPSGLNADTGEPLGAAMRAAVTLTLGAPKHGLLRPAAWPFVGRLEVAPDIGLAPCPCSSKLQWTLSSDFRDFPPRRPVGGHKGTFGHLAIFAGSLGYHGAAVLAARGAQRAQPGLVTLLTTPPVYLPVASQLQAVMVQRWKPGGRWPETATALLFGPGLAAAELAPDYRAEVARCWQASPLPVLVDASALDWLPEGPTPPRALRLVTPHPGEAARLLKSTSAAVQAGRPAALRALSRRYGDCWVVLKGYQTLAGRSEGNLHVNPSGNPALAQGGSGDVLAGYLGGLLAQPALQADPLRALRFAVWQHGAAADWLAAHKLNWTVEELLEVLGEVRAG